MSRKTVVTIFVSRFSLFALLTSGFIAFGSCVNAIRMPPLSFDGGVDASTSSAPDASTPDANQQDAGTDAGVDGGVDGGVIATLPPLPQEKCGKLYETLEPLRPVCGYASPCVGLLRHGSAAETVALNLASGKILRAHSQGALIDGADSYSFAQLQLVKPGEALQIIENTQASVNDVTFEANSVVMNDDGIWYIKRTPSQLELMKWTANSGVTPLGTLPLGKWILAAAVMNGEYFVATPEAIFVQAPVGGNGSAEELLRPASFTSFGESISAFTGEGNDLFFTQCVNFNNQCRLIRFQRQQRAYTLLIDDDELGPTQAGQSQVVLLGSHVYVLGSRKLMRIAREGGKAEPIYEGESFANFQGTLRARSLEAINGKLYLAQVCELDANAPKYATVELDLQSRTASYLEEHVQYPLTPKLEYDFANDLRWGVDNGHARPFFEGVYLWGK